MKNPPIQIECAISKLRPNERNARSHSKKQIQQIANSIRRYGWTYPVITDEKHRILAGHGRIEAAKILRLKNIPVIMLSGLSDAEQRAFALADNKIPLNAGWDRKILARELGELSDLLPEFELTLDITGFETAEIDNLLEELGEPEVDPLDQLPKLENIAVTSPGDLWKLGNHRLLCGDAKSGADLKRLMNDDLAAMVFTDPPYNIRIESIGGRGKTKHRKFAEASGEMSKDQFSQFLFSALNNLAEYSTEGSIQYICMDWRHVAQLIAIGESVFSELKQLIVWNKTNAGQGSFYRSQHELICLFKNGETPHINNFKLGQFGRNRSNVWTYPGVNTFRTGRMNDLAVHPTVKPVALVADAIRDCSDRRAIVLDTFMGSGTTVLAAERVGRCAYGIEIDPLYVDVAIRRWQEFTGFDAVLERTDRTFDELSIERNTQPARRRK